MELLDLIPNFFSHDFLLALGVGVLVGLVSNVLGLGGGILIVPLLPSLMGVSQQESIGTSLFAIFFVVLINTWFFHRAGLVGWSIALKVGPLSAVFSYFAGTMAVRIPELYLQLLLVAVMLYFSLKLYFGKRAGKGTKAHNPHWKYVVGYGSLAGTLSGLCGIGSGLIINPVMIQKGWVSGKMVSPTANGIMAFTTFFGALAFIQGWPQWSVLETGQWGLIHLDVVIGVLVSSQLVGPFFRKFQEGISLAWRRRIFSGLLLVLSLKVLLAL